MFHVEAELHGAVAEEEQVAQEAGCEDRDGEVLEVVDDVGTVVESVGDPCLGAGIIHVFVVPA